MKHIITLFILITTKLILAQSVTLNVNSRSGNTINVTPSITAGSSDIYLGNFTIRFLFSVAPTSFEVIDGGSISNSNNIPIFVDVSLGLSSNQASFNYQSPAPSSTGSFNSTVARITANSTAGLGSFNLTFSSPPNGVTITCGSTQAVTSLINTAPFISNQIGVSCNTNLILPITLKTFTASKLEGNNALLNWSTSSEVDASHFELERSFDLQSWTSIDKQAARGQDGIETSYSFVDQNIIAQRSNDGVCYYRLGMVDIDGSKKKSDIRSINLDPLTETYYQAFPNPAKGVINVQLQVPNMQINMTDLFLMDNAGRVHTKTAVSTNGISKVDVSDLPKGVYHLQVNTGTELLSKKVILVED